MTETKIGFVGTDGRTLLAALETSRATSELYPGAYRGVVVKGTGLELLIPEVTALCIFSVVLVGVAILRFRKRLD